MDVMLKFDNQNKYANKNYNKIIKFLANSPIYRYSTGNFVESIHDKCYRYDYAGVSLNKLNDLFKFIRNLEDIELKHNLAVEIKNFKKYI